MTIAQLQGQSPSYRGIHRWWSWRLALLKPVSYQFYRGHVSCWYYAQPREPFMLQELRAALTQRTHGQLGKDLWIDFHLSFVQGSLVSFRGSSAVSFTSLGHHTLVAGMFLTISWEPLGFLFFTIPVLFEVAVSGFMAFHENKSEGQSSLHTYHHIRASNQASRS